MTLEEVVEQKLKMEKRILEQIQAAVGDFKAATGLSVYSVEIDFSETTVHEDRFPQFEITGVQCRVDF